MNKLHAVYDFHSSPASYDFITFLVWAKFEQERLGLSGLRVYFVQNVGGGWRDDNKPTSNVEKAWRRDHILVPSCRLVGAEALCMPREEVDTLIGECARFPHNWAAQQPEARYKNKMFAKQHAKSRPPSFIPDPCALELVRKWLGPDQAHYITITYRTTYYTERNSNPLNWSAFADWLREKGWCVVEIPDTVEAGNWHDALGSIAAVNVLIRHALYHGAFQNMGADNGPFALCVYSTLPYLVTIFQRGTHHTSPGFYAKQGIPPGSQHIWSGPHRKLTWAEDTLENLRTMFERECELAPMGDDRGPEHAINPKGTLHGEETQARQEKAEVAGEQTLEAL